MWMVVFVFVSITFAPISSIPLQPTAEVNFGTSTMNNPDISDLQINLREYTASTTQLTIVPGNDQHPVDVRKEYSRTAKTFPDSSVEYMQKFVLSYGDVHMTEDDQVFTVRCRYNMAGEETIGTVMEISPFEETLIIQNATRFPRLEEGISDEAIERHNSEKPSILPLCNYTLHINSFNGPLAESAKLGDKVFHKWKCDKSYFVKVYECYVHDGSNRRYMLVDERGCSTDSSIMPDVVYDSTLGFIYAPSWVFKFTNASRMYFNCLLYVCPKNDTECRKTVLPSCKHRKLSTREKRSELLWRRKAFTIGANGGSALLLSNNSNGLTDIFEPVLVEKSSSLEITSKKDISAALQTRGMPPFNLPNGAVSATTVSSYLADPTGVLPTTSASTGSAVTPPFKENEISQGRFTAAQPNSCNDHGPHEEHKIISLQRTIIVLVILNFVTLTTCTALACALCRQRLSSRLKIAI
ncbi:zona pellucida-like domain-containing protein [Ditylenchus destructor]|uniref:Zona pellucida-like domain-containing protein n=1 Tax=Ditylenchus destructor TaxID=166010 RepID=A0AAD4N765_9BILA|nr:zona pellucida-like domain-containing protein [Ditylenchus destructor]